MTKYSPDECLKRCIRWSQWHECWVYKKNVSGKSFSIQDFPNYMPLPRWVTSIPSGKTGSDRSSNCSDKSALDSENEEEVLLSESDGDVLDMDPF